MENKQHGVILVVDDQQSWRELLLGILENDGHEVVIARNFQETKTLLNTKRFDLAIIDMRLVDSDVYNIEGMKVLQEVKRQHPGMKAIIFTGYPDPDQKIKAIEYYHADDYLEKVPGGKPLNIDEFSQKIFNLLKS